MPRDSFSGSPLLHHCARTPSLKFGYCENVYKTHVFQLHTRLMALLRSSCDVADVVMLFVEFKFDERAAASVSSILTRQVWFLAAIHKFIVSGAKLRPTLRFFRRARELRGVPYEHSTCPGSRAVAGAQVSHAAQSHRRDGDQHRSWHSAARPQCRVGAMCRAVTTVG